MKITLGESNCKYEDNINMDLKEASFRNICLRIVFNFGRVYPIMNVRVPLKAEKLLTRLEIREFINFSNSLNKMK
jgi:hypothetical protein